MAVYAVLNRATTTTTHDPDVQRKGNYVRVVSESSPLIPKTCGDQSGSSLFSLLSTVANCLQRTSPAPCPRDSERLPDFERATAHCSQGQYDDIAAVSLTLMNSGSVARDHLASERTYLSYVRTSLALASAGVAVMQFLQYGHKTRKYAALLGSFMILLGIVVLYIGTKRYFFIQKILVTGYYSPSIVGVAAISFALGSLVAATFGIILSEHLR